GRGKGGKTPGAQRLPRWRAGLRTVKPDAPARESTPPLPARRVVWGGSALAVALPPVAPLALGLLALGLRRLLGRAEVLTAAEADQRLAGLGADVGTV